MWAFLKLIDLEEILMDEEDFLVCFPDDLKKKVLDSCILPTLTDGCQIWSPTKKELYRLANCQRRMEWNIVGITLKGKVQD